jgi:uncharacterized protein YjbI with pentapeptide repeats
MRLTGKLGLMAGSIFIFSACNKASPLPRGANDIQQSVVEAPSTESKSDRPSETGEGLPGYLIDPAKLAIESKDNIWTITGSSASVRHENGTAAGLNVWLIKVAKRTARFQKQNQSWQLNGTKLAAIQADAEGAFKIQGTVTADDLLFVKLEDSAAAQIQYKAGAVATSVLWIEGNAAKLIDASSADQIRTQVIAAQPEPNATELARLVEQVKTTGQCRNCNLAGADLSGLEIVECDLSFSNLMGAKFVLSNVASCNFTNSNLSQVDFTQANMAGANLTQADISEANFTGANIEGVIGAQIPVK